MDTLCATVPSTNCIVLCPPAFRLFGYLHVKLCTHKNVQKQRTWKMYEKCMKNAIQLVSVLCIYICVRLCTSLRLVKLFLVVCFVPWLCIFACPHCSPLKADLLVNSFMPSTVASLHSYLFVFVLCCLLQHNLVCMHWMLVRICFSG